MFQIFPVYEMSQFPNAYAFNRDSLVSMDFILYERKNSVSIFCSFTCVKLEITGDRSFAGMHFNDLFGLKDKVVEN